MDRQNRRNMGALRSTHLMEHRHRRPNARDCRCGCDFYQPEWLRRSDRVIAVAHNAVCHRPGEAVCFTHGCAGDAITLHTPGIYYAVYTLHMPGNQPVHTELQLTLDGCPLPESRLHIQHNCDTHEHIVAHAMFEICRPACLQLVTREHLNLHTDGDEPLITLAVFRIG